jgi:hypothetical protein
MNPSIRCIKLVLASDPSHINLTSYPSPRISAEYSAPAGTAHRQTLERLLSAANTLNQIWWVEIPSPHTGTVSHWPSTSDNPSGTRDRIQELAQKHEELQLNIDYLESTRTKNEKEILALQRPQSQPKKAASYKDEDENAVHLQHDIAEHEATIGRLQRVLKNKDTAVCTANRVDSSFPITQSQYLFFLFLSL